MIKKRFEALDAFRGLCALSVVVFHMHLVSSITEWDFFRGSSIFVEFFFVLSGFVLTHGYGYKENLRFKSFIKSRFFRLYPLHLFMFLIFLILELGKLLAYKFGGFIFNNEPFTNRFAINEIIPNLLLIQSWTPFTNHLTFNFPSWSISIEFYMYILLFLSIVIFKNKKVLSWVLISMVAFLLMYFKSEFFVNGVLRGLSCFFGGAITYIIYDKISERIKLSFFIGSMIELFLIIAVIFIVQSSFENKSILASLLFFVTVFCFSFESGIVSIILKTKYFQRSGELSYSIYMTHAAIIFCFTSFAMIIQKIIGEEMAPMIGTIRYLDFGSAMMNNIMVVIMLSVIVFVSKFTYKYIELNGQKLNR